MSAPEVVDLTRYLTDPELPEEDPWDLYWTYIVSFALHRRPGEWHQVPYRDPDLSIQRGVRIRWDENSDTVLWLAPGASAPVQVIGWRGRGLGKEAHCAPDPDAPVLRATATAEQVDDLYHHMEAHPFYLPPVLGKAGWNGTEAVLGGTASELDDLLYYIAAAVEDGTDPERDARLRDLWRHIDELVTRSQGIEPEPGAGPSERKDAYIERWERDFQLYIDLLREDPGLSDKGDLVVWQYSMHVRCMRTYAGLCPTRINALTWRVLLLLAEVHRLSPSDDAPALAADLSALLLQTTPEAERPEAARTLEGLALRGGSGVYRMVAGMGDRLDE